MLFRSKRMLSCRSDRYRSPYGRYAEDFPRQCVFVGTTNETQYLRDVTGARRFWPVTVGDIDLTRIENDRDQLFAEAVHFYKSGAKWHEIPTRDAEVEQEKRRVIDEWEGIVERFLNNPLNGGKEVVCEDIFVTCLGFPISKIDRSAEMRIGKIMRVLGWTRARVGVRNERRWVYRSPDFYDMPVDGEDDSVISKTSLSERTN